MGEDTHEAAPASFYILLNLLTVYYKVLLIIATWAQLGRNLGATWAAYNTIL
jgi:hypothetical protein